METWVLKIIFMVFWVTTGFIRYPFSKEQKKNTITTDKKTTTEKISLLIVLFGMMVCPLVYVFTPLFSFADYQLPVGVHILGIVLILPTLWLFYRSHKDLGKNWSVSLEIRDGHNIVDGGVYKYIRHPMYSAIWMWVILQACLLPNGIAGFAGIVGFGVLYFLRVGQEEAMMQKEFGEEYTDYKQRTKRLIPFIL